jgi:hypothetical protein
MIESAPSIPFASYNAGTIRPNKEIIRLNPGNVLILHHDAGPAGRQINGENSTPILLTVDGLDEHVLTTRMPF